MIITRTPFRISFVGGGSDLEAFYSQHKGAVLSTSINKYMYISSHRYFEPDQIRAKYSLTETVHRAAELQHPILRTVLEQLNISGGIEISSIADVPGGTGMGSSSSFTVGLLHNLHTWTHQPVSKVALAEGACRVEIELLKEPIGKQDQYAAAFGGLNVIEFLPNGQVVVDPVIMHPDAYRQLQKNLMLFYLGNQRSASAILSEQRKNTSEADKMATLMEMVQLVYPLRDALSAGNLREMGKILHENWLLKRTLASGITNPSIDGWYELALKHGALGGKLLGAGGGGFLLLYCEEEHQARVADALQSLRRFDFTFEENGSQVIHYAHE
jgi:D-glycero-alpha-D-manno-heptose-7-phosphate kinase